MAKVTPGAELPGRVKSLRGAVYFRVYRGVIVACKWPRPRGKPKTPEHRRQVEWFRQAQKVASRVDAKTQITIREAFAHSPLMPRDVATSLMAGRMYALRGADNLYIRSRRAMNEVSLALDVISNTPGDTLLRGPAGWTGTPPITAPSRWVWGMSDLAWTESPGVSNTPWKGCTVEPVTPIVVSEIAGILDLVNGAQYRAAVATLDGAGGVTSWEETTTFAATVNARQMIRWELTPIMQPGQRYAFMVGRVDGADNYRLPMVSAHGSSLPWPGPRSKLAVIADATPGVGSTVVATTDGAHAVGLLATF